MFAATDSKREGALTIVVINKNQRVSYDGKISIVGRAARSSCRSARVFVLRSPGGAIVAFPPVTVVNGTIDHALPPLSATLFACGT